MTSPTLHIDLQKELRGSRGRLNLEVKLDLPLGQTLGITGPSGSGKTSLLRMLAGLMRPDGGTIRFDQERWYDGQENQIRPPQMRSIGMVFQDYALFPHLSVLENLRFPALPEDDPGWPLRLLELMDLVPLANQKPGQLSGGQKQRVALARALVRKPRLLLLDEPLAALDEHLRHRLQDDLMQLQQKLGMTVLLVSHDQRELARLADQVLVLENGQISSLGSKQQLLAIEPENLVAEVVSLDQEKQEMIVLAGRMLLRLPLKKEVSMGERIKLAPIRPVE